MILLGGNYAKIYVSIGINVETQGFFLFAVSEFKFEERNCEWGSEIFMVLMKKTTHDKKTPVIFKHFSIHIYFITNWLR